MSMPLLLDGTSLPPGESGEPLPDRPTGPGSVVPSRVDSIVPLAPVAPRAGEGAFEGDRQRLKVALEAISGLAGCLDQLLRDLRRGVGPAQWRAAQDEVMRVRRLVTARPDASGANPEVEITGSRPPAERPHPGLGPTALGPTEPPTSPPAA